MLYEPFGTQITSTPTFASANPTVPFATSTTPPANAQGNQSYAWAGGHRRSNETSFALAPVQMGARVYIPSMGRFLSVDPLEGGTMNNYVYVVDPINSNDYSGEWGFVMKAITYIGPLIQRAVAIVNPIINAIASKAKSAYQYVAKTVSGAINRPSGGSAGSSVANAGRAATSKATTATVQKSTPLLRGYNTPQLSQQRLEHIVQRHWATSSATNAGKFGADITGAQLKGMINQTVGYGTRSANTFGRSGSIYESNVGKIIGSNKDGQLSTNLRVVVDEYGNIITSFPY